MILAVVEETRQLVDSKWHLRSRQPTFAAPRLLALLHAAFTKPGRTSG
ncbi:hypothetical protein LGH74_08685 [Hymenobacter sp. BT178]|uniref:Uncharacterized protein n=1 Tax=Hymenobacter lucidus TaxID=2880930 RepID=A0ABS8ATL2_9BACT|nr:hypothetical protein [Hymenobacter lucidus]